MDTDWCIMCDSHCNISGAIYCSEECKLRDRMENAYYPPSSSSSTTPSSSSSSSSPSLSPLLTSTSVGAVESQCGTNLKHSSKVQLPPPQQPTLFYHRAPMPRYYKPGASNACSSTRSLRVRRMSKSLYVQ